jgi:hypothetical protein
LELEQIHPAGKNFSRVTLNPQRCELLRVAYVNADGSEYFAEEYDNYREVPGGAFPTRFALVWPKQNRFVRLNLKDLDLGRPADALNEAFAGIDNLDMDKVMRKPLNQARVESDEK